MSSVIYYFTGTGNSLKIAKDLAKELEETSIIQICTTNMTRNNALNFENIGIVFPVYYYGLPIMVKQFIENLNINQNSYVFAVATCGGSVGGANEQLMEILNNKGIMLSSAFTVVMPNNYQILFSVPSIKKQKKLFNSEKDTIKYISQKIRNHDLVQSSGFNKHIAKLKGKIFAKIFIPRFKDKNFWKDENCSGCGLCSKVCPANNIALVNGTPKWIHQCEHCLACMQWCPKEAIQFRKNTLKKGRYHHPEIKVEELFNKSSK